MTRADPRRRLLPCSGLAFGPTFDVTSYCTPKFASNLCHPMVRASGHPRLSGTDHFIVHAYAEMNNASVCMLWNLASASTPFAGGTLCVAPPITRTEIQSSGGNPPPTDCSGEYAFHFSAAYMTAHELVPGPQVYAQFWGRDQGYAPPDDVGQYDALTFTIEP